MPYKQPAQSAEKRMELWYEYTLGAMDTILHIIDEIEILEARYDLEENTPTLDETSKLCTEYVEQIEKARTEYARMQGEFFEVMPTLWQLLGEHQQDALKEQFSEVMRDIRSDLLWFVEKEPLISERLVSLCARNVDHWSDFQATAAGELELLYNNIRHGAEYILSIVGDEKTGNGKAAGRRKPSGE